MAGFPIEEAFVAPTLALVAALGVPALTRKLAPKVLPPEATPAAEEEPATTPEAAPAAAMESTGATGSSG